MLQQVGPPQDVYAKPANLFVARFIGNPPMNTVRGPVRREGDGLAVTIAGGAVAAAGADRASRRRQGVDDVVVGVRPEHLRRHRRRCRPRDRHRRRVARARTARRLPPRGRADADRAADERRAGTGGGRGRRARGRSREISTSSTPESGAGPTSSHDPASRRSKRGPARRTPCSRRCLRCRLRRLRLLPVPRNFESRSTARRPSPGFRRRTSASTRSATCCRRTTSTNSLWVTILLPALHGADRDRPRARSSPCSPTRSCRGIRDLPDDLLVDGRNVGRGRRR